MHLSRSTRSACSQQAHASGCIGQNPGEGIASKSGFPFRPFAADQSHDVVCGDIRQRKGEPIDGQGKDLMFDSGDTSLMLSAKPPCYQSGGVSSCARPARAARRARRSSSQTGLGIPFHR